MIYRVLLHPKAAEFLRQANPPLRTRIKDRLRDLGNAPREKGQRLTHSPFWRLRIGEYRAIDLIAEAKKEVVILFIGHRREVTTASPNYCSSELAAS